MCHRAVRIVKVVLPVAVLVAISLHAPTNSEALTAQPPQRTHNLTTRQSVDIGAADHVDRTHPQVQGSADPNGPYQYFFPIIAHGSPSGKLAVFPGAEGFGTDTPAGRGGKIIRVTTLADSGPGSLRAALNASGPRTVVFEVGGIIWLESELEVTNPYLTIAGQTAPSPGITIAHGPLRFYDTHDVLVQHIRIRVGDSCPLGAEACDGLTIRGNFNGPLVETYNIVIDHCSISWAIDKNLSTRNPGAHDVTVSNTIIGESVRYPKERLQLNFLIGQHSKRVAAIGNLFAHSTMRNPVFAGDTSGLAVNNVVYNSKTRGMHLQNSHYLEKISASIVGNVLIPGPDTASWWAPIEVLSSVTADSRLYVEDNEAPGRTANPWSVVTIRTSQSVKAYEPPIWVSPLTVRRSEEVLPWVLANAGARPWDRDAVDIRIVSDVLNGTGKIIDSQNEVGGWPVSPSTYRALDLPPRPNDDDDRDGYTNLEEWLFEFK